MAETIIRALVTIFGVIGGSGLIGGLILSRLTRLESKLDLRERDRVNESLLTGGCLTACERLTLANTSILRELDGENVCERELEALRQAREELDRFLLKKSAEYLHSG